MNSIGGLGEELSLSTSTGAQKLLHLISNICSKAPLCDRPRPNPKHVYSTLAVSHSVSSASETSEVVGAEHTHATAGFAV